MTRHLNLTTTPRRPAGGGWLLAAMALAVLCLPAVGRAQVHDNAGMFSDQAKQKALDSIGQLKQKLGRTLLVETYDKVPPERAAELESKGRAKFVADFARERGKAEQVDGVVLVLFKDTGDGRGRYDVVIGKETAKKLFTASDLTDMKSGFETALKDKRYDEALTRTADYVLKRMVENNGTAKPAAAAPANSGGSVGGAAGGPSNPRAHAEPSCGVGGMGLGTFLCVGVAVVGAVLLFRGIGRARQQQMGYGQGGGMSPGGPGYGQGGYGGGPGYGGPGYGGPGYGAPGGGGGFGRGILGGVLGGVAGSYIGNKVFGHDAPAAPPAGGMGSAPPVDPGPGHDTDYTDAGGGDFGGGGGDASSGFDSGGGFDAGGGDFGGGGDSGGGGGDF